MVIPLAMVSEGERVEIVDFIKPGRGLLCRLRDIGISPGRIVEVLANQGHGPILLKIGESRIAIGRGMAMKILTRRV
ncbi:MAG: FeoA family protein [Dictyoglomus sp.]|jgi:ferrous iron transport protein A